MIAPNPQGQPATMSPAQANQLTSYLYGLKTPEAVQAYAAQHQNDINVVGIASGVANAMKRAQQQQQPQQVQPSVTQQAIAQMAPRAQMPQQMPQQAPQMAPQGQPMQQPPQAQLPENTGIGQLPVPSMQSMAGGGITGEPVHMENGVRRFDPGGSVSSLDQIQQQSIAQFQPTVQQFQDANNQWIAALQSGDPQSANQYFQQKEALRNQMMQQADSRFGNAAPSILQKLMTPAITNVAGQAPAPVAPSPAPANTAPVAPEMFGGEGRVRKDIPYPGAVPKNLLPTADTGLKLLANAPAAKNLNPALATKPMETHDFDFYKKKMLEASTDPVETQYNDIQANVRNLQEAAKAAGYDFENSKAFAQLQKLDDKSSELLDRKQNLAIIQAGLGMIRSGNPFEAIAAGAGQGLKSYGEALDQSQATQQKLAESRIALEQSKNAMAAGLFGKAADYQLKGAELHHDAIKNSNTLAAGMSEADARNANAIAINNANIAKDYGIANLHNTLMTNVYSGKFGMGQNKLTEAAEAKAQELATKDMADWTKNNIATPFATPEAREQARAAAFATALQTRRAGFAALAGTQPAAPVAAGKVIDYTSIR